MKHRMAWLLTSILTPSLTFAGGTVTLRLSSPLDGRTVPPGTSIPWMLSLAASIGDNAGLALVLADLYQAPDNPGKLDIPRASFVPAAFGNFSRPQGISNVADDGIGTGFTGLQRGLPGEKNLIQIGGAQNTFGSPGFEAGTNPIVVGGVGQGGEIVLAQGAFPAPEASGAYTFVLANAIANTLDEVSQPPEPSRVGPAGVVLARDSIRFTVGSTELAFVRGSSNGDRETDLSDGVAILWFLFLNSPARLACERSADADANGRLEITDAIYILNYLFLGGPEPPPPFPDCGQVPSGDPLPCEAFPACQ